MEQQNSAHSVEQLIQQYRRELMELRHKSREDEDAKEVMQHIEAQFPLPDLQRDLQVLREQRSAFLSPSEAEDNAVENETEGQDADREPIPEILPPSAPPPTEMSLGYLRTFVTTAKGALPIPNAQVIVTRLLDGQELLEQVARTDNSGYSPLFTLPAVSGIYSQTPDNKQPYTYYNVYVRAGGFYPVLLRNVPMYGGVTATQPIDLIPVAEGRDPNEERVVNEGAPENLN